MLNVFNFVALLVLLYFLLRKPAVQTFVKRHQEYSRLVEESRVLLTNAKSKFEEFNSKLKSIDNEVEFIKSSAEKEAQSSALRIVQNAEALSTDLIADAHQRAQSLVKGFARDVTLEVTEKVINETEKIISQKVTKEDQIRFQEDFSLRVVRGAM